MLSLPKILLTAAIIAGVFLIARAISRRSRVMTRKSGKSTAAKAGTENSLDLNKCPVCDTYLGPDSPGCERPECPRRG